MDRKHYQSSLSAKLADAQDPTGRADRPAFNTPKRLFRLYTEHLPLRYNVRSLIGRYFDGATLYYGTGLDARTQADAEDALVIEIVSSKSDALQRVLDLAGDIRALGQQVSVLVGVQDVRTFEVTDGTAWQRYEHTAGNRPLDRPTDSPRYNPLSKAQAHRLGDV